MILQAGEKRKFSDVGLPTQLTVTVTHGQDGLDVSAFSLSAERKMLGDEYIAFYNNPRTPDGAVSARLGPREATFTLDLTRLASGAERVMFTATHDTLPLRSAPQLLVQVGSVTFDARPALGDEKAAMLLELYRHGGEWRVGAVGQGFAGGLGDLVKYFGGEVEEATAPQSPPPAPAVSLKNRPRCGWTNRLPKRPRNSSRSSSRRRSVSKSVDWTNTPRGWPWCWISARA